MDQPRNYVVDKGILEPIRMSVVKKTDDMNQFKGLWTMIAKNQDDTGVFKMVVS